MRATQALAGTLDLRLPPPAAGGVGALAAEEVGVLAGAAAEGAGDLAVGEVAGEAGFSGLTGAGAGVAAGGAGTLAWGWGGAAEALAPGMANEDWHLRQRAVLPAKDAGTRSAAWQLGHRMEMVSSLMARSPRSTTSLDRFRWGLGNRAP